MSPARPPGRVAWPPRTHRRTTDIDLLRRRALGRSRSFEGNASPFRKGVERDRPLAFVNVLGVVAVILGVGLMARSSTWGYDAGAAFGAMVGQLGGTLWPAIAMSVAVTLQVLAGASVVRVLRWAAYRSLSEALTAGAVAIIAIDILALAILGPLGMFGWFPLLLITVALAALCVVARPFFSPGVLRAPRADPAAWLLVAVVWCAPVLLQLASPVAPFIDVLPNHVAPVEHLRTFGSWETLAVSPSPIYGPSRVFLGYIAPVAAMASLVGLGGGMAVAAFALPLTVLFAASGRLLARTIGSQRAARGLGQARDTYDVTDDPDATSAAYWVLLTLPLTFAFLRLPDTRATVLAFVPAALALVVTMDASRWAGRSRPVMLAIALGVGVLVHPVIGAFAMGTVAVIGVATTSRARAAFSGIAGGLVIASPALLITLGVQVTPLVVLPLALGGVALAAILGGRAARDDWSIARPAGSALKLQPILLALASLVLVAAGLALLIAVRPSSIEGVVAETIHGLLDWGLLLLLLIPFVTLGRGRQALGAAVLVGVAAAFVAAALGEILPETDLIIQSLAYELPKSAGYWVPWAISLGAGLGLAALWGMRDLPGWVRVGIVSVWVVLASVSFLPDDVEPEAIEQHRYAESLGIALVNAQDGYWLGYPDPRVILDAPREELVRAVRAEIGAGRLGGTTPVLHVASTFQQWEATPLGVFTGVMETDVSPDAEHSIHTLGGRLESTDSLPRLLAGGYPYVVVEDQPASVVDEVVAAGYVEVWRGERVVLLRRAQPGG